MDRFCKSIAKLRYFFKIQLENVLFLVKKLKKVHFDGNFCGVLTVTFAVFWR